ncbi:MAG: hypothetical protein J2P55_04915 [Rhizobiales bacterium]|nr:hypothetical protein [Hyphomicrobiales bacterium]
MLSGVSAGAAPTTFGGCPSGDAAAADALAAVDAGTVVVLPALPAAVGGTDVVWAAAGAAVFGHAAADGAGIGATGVVRPEISDLSLGGAAATEAGGEAGFAGPVAIAGAGAAGATDGTAAARTLVTIARAATGDFSGSLGRSTRESTTPAPAVAPIAVATKTTRAVRAKLGAGAK